MRSRATIQFCEKRCYNGGVSKAFTRESDDLPERAQLKRPASSLPPGAKNYFTPDGIEKLRRELETLSGGPDSPAVRQRIFEIEHSLNSAVVSPTPPPPWNQVLFGATVTVRDRHGEESTCRIVGVEETDIERDWVSYLSPLAKALLKAKVGDRMRFKVPAGEQELEIIRVDYEPRK
jgi:transcription elongation factor GreB